LADEIKCIVRDKISFDLWLCSQEMDGIFSQQEKKKIEAAVKKAAQ
jgi:hypothetical protein